MSHLRLDQNELLRVFGPDSNLKYIITHYEEEFQKMGEVICRIHVNELHLSEDDEARLQNTPISEIKSLAVVTENPTDLFNDVLKYWKLHIPALITSADHLSQSLRFKSIDQSAVELSKFIDQCHLLVNSLNSISSLCQHRAITLPSQWSSSEFKLWKAFNELLDTFNNKNTTIMADIIEYDLGDSLQTWLEVLTEM